MASSIPDHVVLERDRDLDGRGHEIWIRRALLTLVLLVPLAALLNAFGQRPQTETSTGAAATLKVSAPLRVRAGLLYQARFTITARRELRRAMLRFDPGWFESLTINTIEPQPESESTDGEGRPIFTLGRIAAGDRFRLFVYYQVNPTNVGRRSQDVELLDGDAVVAHVDRSITVFP